MTTRPVDGLLPHAGRDVVTEALDADATWMPVQQRRRHPSRRRVVAALTAAIAIAVAISITMAQDPAEDIAAGPGPSSDGQDDPQRDEGPGDEALTEGSLVQFDDEFGAIVRSGHGRVVVKVEAPSGVAMAIPMDARLAAELGQFSIVARAALLCDPACGWAEVIAEYRPSRPLPEPVPGEFERGDGVGAARMNDPLDVLRFEIGPWMVSVLLGNIPPEFIDDWASRLPLRVGSTGWVGVGGASSQFRLLEGESSVEFGAIVNYVQVSASACSASEEGTSVFELDDGGTSVFGTVCLSGGRFTLTADSEAAFVTRVVDGIRPS